MNKILILMGRYLPGHKDGGPLRTIINVTDALGDEYEFFIACLDRDHGDAQAYPGIRRDAWNQVGKAKVWYVAPGGFTDELLLKLADGKDLIYLCSFYDDYGYKTLLLRKKGLLKTPIALASMGVFSLGALKQKALKKRLFITLCKVLGLFRGITWSVTSELEAQDVKRVMGNRIQYIVAEDIPRSSVPGRKQQEPHTLRIAFLSRICAHKGLDMAIDAIAAVKRDCQLTIYGPIQEEAYWQQCQDKLKQLDKPWHYYGDVLSEDVQRVLADEDVLILPTRSENYGHVIFEALSVGCVPIISNTTPWTMLDEKGAGFAVERNADAFAMAIDGLQDLEPMKDACVQLAREKAAQTKAETGYRTIFG